ncbi:MAG: hypothetical protein OM95_06470 [Bdellovibrio sp. ArHS]|uniref:LysE family transporter n=1 Tax=Bdellovibrio sp. ArHS TaxID=1569284 RepID=UPI000583717F|nr:LysE family transporter [Bdellovibrio sp. ArHS]KHD88772.1 MAG: hypothetical protein OM95_06470 [Bdellovibrio sp. ArHS]
MILWLISIGFISAFALGPASFNIIRSLVAERSWPWKSIAGFLVGDVIYIGLALALLQSPWLQQEWLRILLTILTVICLILYSAKILLSAKASTSLEGAIRPPSFRKSFLLTMGNFHLVFIYAGLFSNMAAATTSALLIGALSYTLAFLVSFVLLLFVISHFKSHLKQILRHLEVIAACGFLTFSAYLSMGIL